MSNQCLWEAYLDHLEYIGELFLPGHNCDWVLYSALKKIGQEDINKPTWGGITPWIIKYTAENSGLYTSVEHAIWTPEHYLADATPIQKAIIETSDFGPEGITLHPAIYCSLDSQHAFFAKEIPEGNIVLAIQLHRKEK